MPTMAGWRPKCVECRDRSRRSVSCVSCSGFMSLLDGLFREVVRLVVQVPGNMLYSAAGDRFHQLGGLLMEFLYLVILDLILAIELLYNKLGISAYFKNLCLEIKSDFKRANQRHVFGIVIGPPADIR